jgi:hypothetical protein
MIDRNRNGRGFQLRNRLGPSERVISVLAAA